VKERPAYKPKIVHKVQFVDQNGNGSALCFKRPHPIDLKTESGVLYWESGVTCPKCLQRKPETTP
jgi:hypothetical protein